MYRKIITILLSSFLLLWFLDEVRSFTSNPETLDDILLNVFKKFTYITDKEQYGEDRKISFAKQVKEGKSFKGDCDDFAYTIRDLLIEKGYKAITVLVRTPPVSNSILHMVVKVDDKYMIDNRHPFVRTWKQGVTGSQYHVLSVKEIIEELHKK